MTLSSVSLAPYRTSDILQTYLPLFQHIWNRWKWEIMFMGRSSWFRCNDATVFDINRLHFYGGGRDLLPSSHTADWTTAAENNSVMDQSPAERTWLTTEHIFSKEKLECLANQHFCSYNALEKNRFRFFSAASPSWQTGKSKSLQSFYFGQEYDVKAWLIGEMTHGRFCIKMATWQVVYISCTFINCEKKKAISDSGWCLCVCVNVRAVIALLDDSLQ